MDTDRIFTADQIAVPPDLPRIIKNYSKAVIRANPVDILEFSLQYFEKEMTKAAETIGNTYDNDISI
jgi:Regulatory subunit of type II PKA R-subunit